MKTERAIELAGGPKALAELLEITPSAVSQWGEDVPQAREWQLKVVRPEWFGLQPCNGAKNGSKPKAGGK